MAQGVGSTFLEAVEYDSDGGLLTSSLVHYLLPNAWDVPEHIDIVHLESPSEHPGGMRGIGEAGLHASVAALANAVEDAVGTEVNHVPIAPDRIADLVESVGEDD